MRKLAAGNWKMNGLAAALSEADQLIAAFPKTSCEILLCPPATLLSALSSRAQGHNLLTGGQDCHAAANGAHTGDISAPMLKDAGASFVILGHSERRADHGESNEDVCAKIKAAWAAGLGAILCLGETEAERDAGQTLAVIASQLKASLPQGATAANTVVAYEPIWAIGTGRTPSLDEIATVHAALRAELMHLCPHEAAQIALLYGGSVKPSNAAEIFALPNVNGALVGGASLKAEDFGQIIQALEAA